MAQSIGSKTKRELQLFHICLHIQCIELKNIVMCHCVSVLYSYMRVCLCGCTWAQKKLMGSQKLGNKFTISSFHGIWVICWYYMFSLSRYTSILLIQFKLSFYPYPFDTFPESNTWRILNMFYIVFLNTIKKKNILVYIVIL